MKKLLFVLFTVSFLILTHCSDEKDKSDDPKKDTFPTERTPEVLKKYSGVYTGEHLEKESNNEETAPPQKPHPEKGRTIYPPKIDYQNVVINYSTDNKVIIRVEKSASEYLCSLYDKISIESDVGSGMEAALTLIVLAMISIPFSRKTVEDIWKLTGDIKSTGHLGQAKEAMITFYEYREVNSEKSKILGDTPFLDLDTGDSIILRRKPDQQLPSFDEINSSCFK